MLPIYQVDAFTDKPFWGNPAAVCILPGQRDEEWMQKVAREMNLSETAFLYQDGNGYRLRWFTPTTEVDLCGHATLAAAHILWEQGYLAPGEEARFFTKSGLLSAEQDGDWIKLNFPAEGPTKAEIPSFILEALQVTPRYSGKNRFDYLIEVDSEDTVRNLKPDFTLLRQMAARGVIVTGLAKTGDYDFVSRLFAPGAGIDEDPVTGSAHCCLGPYWQQQLKKDEFLAYQASARGGLVKVKVLGDRVSLGGRAVTVLRGELLY